MRRKGYIPRPGRYRILKVRVAPADEAITEDAKLPNVAALDHPGANFHGIG